LQAKIANVADIAQRGRQDARHVAILAQVLPAYLEDLQKAAIEGRMAERKLIEFLERLLAVVTAEKARKAFKELQLDARALFAGLGHEKLPKLRGFIDKRLPRKLS
jgi:rubrerythrin